MTGMREDLERRLHHQQARTWHVDATRPGFTHPDTTACPNPHCIGGRIDTTPPATSHPAAQTDTACPVCDGTGLRLECTRSASCGPDDHTYTWPCVFAPGTGDRSPS